jgi:hypothetical protein
MLSFSSIVRGGALCARKVGRDSAYIVWLKLVGFTEVESTAGESWMVREHESEPFFLNYAAVL